MLADALQDIDEIGIRVDSLQLTRHQQALDDADLLGTQFTPAETPVSPFMESFTSPLCALVC
jgi:NaMN:DMB phosphoribosyltransferase